MIVGNGINSSIVVYAVEEDVLTNEPCIKQLWQKLAGEDHVKVKGQSSKDKDHHPLQYSDSSRGRSQRDVRLTGKDYNYGDAFYMAEITPAGNVIAIQEREKGGTFVHLYCPEGKLLRVKELEVSKEESNSTTLHTLFISSYQDGCYAIGLQGGVVVLLEAETLEIASSFKVVSYSISKFHISSFSFPFQGYSSRTCTWDGNALVLPSDGGKLSWWSTCGEKLHEFKVGGADYIVRLDWSVSGHALWICGFSNLGYLHINRDANGTWMM